MRPATIKHRASGVGDGYFGGLKIHKFDSTNSRRHLADAVFDVRDSTGATIATPTTNANGEAAAINIPAGSYTLVETQAPTGYAALTSGIDALVTLDQRKHGHRDPEYSCRSGYR